MPFDAIQDQQFQKAVDYVNGKHFRFTSRPVIAKMII